MRILLQRATDHERQEGLSELHANATGLRPGAMGGPTCQVGLSFLLLRRLAVLWWYGCVWKWCTLPNSHLNREHDDMFFKHTYILNIVKLLYIYIYWICCFHSRNNLVFLHIKRFAFYFQHFPDPSLGHSFRFRWMPLDVTLVSLDWIFVIMEVAGVASIGSEPWRWNHRSHGRTWPNIYIYIQVLRYCIRYSGTS